MTKEEHYAIWNRYYQRHKTEINARRKIVRENYKNKLSKAENKIAELEGQVTRAFEVLEGKRKQIEELEKENATLKKQLEALSGDIPWKDIKDKSEVIGQLTRATEIISEFIEWANWQGSKCSSFKSIQDKAEQFIKE